MTTLRTLAAVFTWIFLASPATSATTDIIHPYLRDQMNVAEDGEMLEAYVVLSDQRSLLWFEERTAGMGPRERRAFVAAELKSHAEETQAPIRAYFAEHAEDGRAVITDVLWMGNALYFTAEPSVIEGLAELPGIDRIRPIVTFEEEAYWDISPPPLPMGSATAVYPFKENFETGSLSSAWTSAVTGAGTIEVSGNESPNGNFHVLMDSAVNATESTASIEVVLDLVGETDVGIRFQWKEFADEDDPGDGVFVSEDGINYSMVLALTGGSTSYATKTVDLDSAIASLGLNYTSAFHIRFAWDDNYEIPTDGFAFDDIEIAPGVGEPPPTGPEPNIVQMQAPQLWDIGFDGSGVLIADVDSGVTWTHTDLINRIWNNPGETPNNGIDDDSNGKIDDIVGWDFISNGNDPTSGATHGTLTAGLMVGDGSAGFITGMAPGGTLAAMEISGEANAWQAQQYALDIGADVVSSSHSYKWPFSPKPDYHMHRQICDMELAGAIIHTNSIGNQGNLTGSGYPIPWNISAPGNCPQPWINPQAAPGGRSSVLGCAGIHVPDDSLYTSSGQGNAAWEDILLYDPTYPHAQDPAYWDYPWTGSGSKTDGLLKPDLSTYTDTVLSTTNSGGYSAFSGTSAATPQLGGGMMLLWDVQPNALPRHLAAAAELSATDLGPAGKDTRYGSGKLQIFDAGRRLVVLGRAASPSVSIGTPLHFDVFGEPNTVVYPMISGGLNLHSPGAFILASPFFFLPGVPLDAAGEGAVTYNIPNDPTYIGFTVYFQFGAKAINTADWGVGAFLSTPEAVTFNP